MSGGPVVPAPARGADAVLRGLTRALLAVAALLAFVWGFARLQSPEAFYGAPYPAKPEARVFSATDQLGRPFDTASLRGRVVALFFGFTHCPNVCPTTLRYLEEARASLPADQRERVKIVFVTLDPARDTPAKLRDYADFFGKGIVALRLDDAPLRDVTGAYGVSFAKTDVRGDAYSISHTAATYVIDPAGRLRLALDTTQLPEVARVAADFARLLKEN